MALTTPVFIDRTTFGAYYFFAGSAFVCTVACFLYMFETKGHTLEVIEQRYTDAKANSTGRWTMEGFKMRSVVTSREVPVMSGEESEGSDGTSPHEGELSAQRNV